MQSDHMTHQLLMYMEKEEKDQLCIAVADILTQHLRLFVQSHYFLLYVI